LAILARNRSQILQWPVGQLHRLSTALPKQASLLAHGPDVARRLEQEILPIWRPSAATLSRWIVPTGQQRMKVSALRRDFPKGRRLGLGVCHGKAESFLIGRPSRPAWGAGCGHELARSASIN